ncbi:MAG: hypothetical protein HUU20_17865 [Pirellulales bacterium]|nr:hypothetical protein [Pirellulales bacterium]
MPWLAESTLFFDSLSENPETRTAADMDVKTIAIDRQVQMVPSDRAQSKGRLRMMRGNGWHPASDVRSDFDLLVGVEHALVNAANHKIVARQPTPEAFLIQVDLRAANPDPFIAVVRNVSTATLLEQYREIATECINRLLDHRQRIAVEQLLGLCCPLFVRRLRPWFGLLVDTHASFPRRDKRGLLRNYAS